MSVPDRYKPFFESCPALALVGGTRLFRVHVPEIPANGAEVWAKAEWANPGGSIKDRPVMRMLLEGVLSGNLTPGRTVIDSSSGNAGIAYAMIGSALGYPVQLVVPGNASRERKLRIRAHGASLVETDALKGYDEALREAHRRATDTAIYYHPDQYANEDNWRAHYETTAVEILEQTGGKLTHFVAVVGTGGTITGVGRRLKEHDPRIQVVCIVPEAFPGIEGLKSLERPEDIVPKILDASVIDRRIRVTIDEAYALCLSLAKQGVFVGQSSGAFLKGAIEVAREDPKARIVTVFSDTGERYFSTGMWDPQ